MAIIVNRVLATKAVMHNLWHHVANLSYTKSGYGNRIPTRYKIAIRDEKKATRRVYCVIHSNVGSLYIFIKGVKVFLDNESDLPELVKKG